jgi:hypothetical protein
MEYAPAAAWLYRDGSQVRTGAGKEFAPGQVGVAKSRDWGKSLGPCSVPGALSAEVKVGGGSRP